MRFPPITVHLPLAIFASLLLVPQTTSAGEGISGKWTSIVEGFGGGANAGSIDFKQDGGTLSGSYEDGFGSAQIEGGKAEDGAISFKITREFGQREMVSTFSGKIVGEAIEGTLSVDGRNGPREMSWEAYRTPAVDPGGLWKWTTTSGRDGSERDSWVKLKFARGELTGTYRTERGETTIKDPVLDGKTVSFKVERRFRDRVWATEYRGEVGSDGISGSIVSSRGGERREDEWKATRDTPAADPVGTWTWTTRWGRDGDGFENKLTIRNEGGSIAGSYTGRGGEAAIEDAQLEGNVFSFRVTNETDRGPFTSSFRGEIDGDIYEPVVATQFGEREMKRSITAKRALPPADPAGIWKWTSRRGRNGGETESVLTLKQSDDGQLTGTLARGDSESPVGDVKLEGNELSFTSERSWRDNPVTVRYRGTVRGDEIDGTTRMGDGDGAGAWASFWSARRSE